MQTPPAIPGSPLESLALLTADLNSQVRALQAENGSLLLVIAELRDQAARQAEDPEPGGAEQ